MADIKKREYVLWLTKKYAEAHALKLDKNNFGHQIYCGQSLRKLRDKVLGYPSESIAAIGFREGEGIEKIRMLSVYNQSIKEQVRTKEAALDELLGQSVDQLLRQPVKTQ